jgi:hypothetical protein
VDPALFNAIDPLCNGLHVLHVPIKYVQFAMNVRASLVEILLAYMLCMESAIIHFDVTHAAQLNEK